jgi:hypothetical protein
VAGVDLPETVGFARRSLNARAINSGLAAKGD